MRRGLIAARRSDGGYTLIELQVVVVIVGVLSGVGFAAVDAVKNRAVKAACVADLSNVETASSAYHAEYGSFATAIDDPPHTSTTLVGARYLRAAPGNGGYTIVYRPADGSVRGEVGATSCRQPT
jgi:prepilin-type N-terminal cleavage/methylation domain-containing protein